MEGKEGQDLREVLVEDAEQGIEAPLPARGDFYSPVPANKFSKIFFLAPRGSRESTRWLYATIILCCYGFFKEFKPSEPFLTPYLVDYKNFTKSEVSTVQLDG